MRVRVRLRVRLRDSGFGRRRYRARLRAARPRPRRSHPRTTPTPTPAPAPMPVTRCPSPDARHPSPVTRHPMPDARCPTPAVGHANSRTQHHHLSISLLGMPAYAAPLLDRNFHQRRRGVARGPRRRSPLLRPATGARLLRARPRARAAPGSSGRSASHVVPFDRRAVGEQRSRAGLVHLPGDAGGAVRQRRAPPEDRLPHGHDLGCDANSSADRLRAWAGPRARLPLRRRGVGFEASVLRHRRRRALHPRAQGPALRRPGSARGGEPGGAREAKAGGAHRPLHRAGGLRRGLLRVLRAALPASISVRAGHSAPGARGAAGAHRATARRGRSTEHRLQVPLALPTAGAGEGRRAGREPGRGAAAKRPGAGGLQARRLRGGGRRGGGHLQGRLTRWARGLHQAAGAGSAAGDARSPGRRAHARSAVPRRPASGDRRDAPRALG